jgi:3-dehydroquinate dehydratase-2
MKIQIINGPNLNLLEKREKSMYGGQSFEGYLKILTDVYSDYEISYFQSNIEGEIVNKIQETGFGYDSIIINAGGYTHTSVAIRDAIEMVKCPVVEVHISNILDRDDFRHKSIIGPVCTGSIMGFGLDSYRLAVESLRIKNRA